MIRKTTVSGWYGLVIPVKYVAPHLVNTSSQVGARHGITHQTKAGITKAMT